MSYNEGMLYDQRSSDDPKAWPLSRTWRQWWDLNWPSILTLVCILTLTVSLAYQWLSE